MGFTDHGKQCLLPEEALYLLECVSRMPRHGTSELFLNNTVAGVIVAGQ